MKKLTILLTLIAFLGLSNSNAQLVKHYIVNENFDGLSALPDGWTVGFKYFYYAGTTTLDGSVLNASSGGSGSRGQKWDFPNSGGTPLVYISFDLTVNSSTIGQKNGFGLVLDGLDAASEISTTADPKKILCLYACGSDGKFHYANTDLDTLAYNSDDTWGASFRRAGTTLDETNAWNLGTQIDFGFSLGVTYNIRALMNFTAQTVDSLIITNLSDMSKIELGAFPFYEYVDNIVSISGINIFNSRGSNQGNGSSTNLNASIDNFEVYNELWTGVEINNSVAFNIYPTLTSDVINVEGNISTIEIFNIAGQKVNNIVPNNTKTVVNMNNLTSGLYIVKATMVDGSKNVRNVILK